MPRRQRTVGDQAHVHLPANGDQFPLVLAVQQVVVVFHGFKSSPAMVAGAELQIVELIAIHGRRAQRAHLADPDEAVEGFHGFFNGRGIIEAVDDVQIDVVGAKTPERAVDFAKDRLAGEMALVKINLCRQHDLIALSQLFQRAGKVCFAGAERVGVGRIEKVDVQIERAPDDGFACVGVERPVEHFLRTIAKAHAADANAGDGQIGSAKFRILHGGYSSCKDLILSYTLEFASGQAFRGIFFA